MWPPWGRKWAAPSPGSWVCSAGGCCQPHGAQPPFPLDTCGFGPDGLVPRSLSREISSAGEELLLAETCCLFGALGSSLASAPCGKGSQEHREEQCCCQGGRRGGFSSPTHISTVVIHRSVTGTSVQRERSNTGPAEQRNCFQGCCLLARGCVVIVTADWGFLIYFLPLPCPFPCSKLTSVALKVGRASIFESCSCYSPSLGRVGHLGSLVRL